MTLTEKRLLRQKVQVEVSHVICELANNDDEYLLALLYASQQIGNDLARFDDMFDEEN